MEGPGRPESKEPLRQPPTELDAMNRKGEITSVHILHPRFISQGRFGVVFEATARTIGITPILGAEPPFDARRRAHEFPVIVKVFLNPRDAGAAHSLYDVCREAALRTLPTYRIDEKRGVALMTGLNDDITVALSSNNWNLRSDAVHISEIPNWPTMLDDFFQEAAKATEYQIELQSDVYFFKIPINTNTPILEFYAADFDTIIHPSAERNDKLLQLNVTRLNDTADGFVRKYVDAKAQRTHLKELMAARARFVSSRASET